MSFGRSMFAASYDFLMKGMERQYFRKIREGLLRQAKGRTLEIGAGTGANLEWYESGHEKERVFLEPSRPMLTRGIRKGMKKTGTPVQGDAAQLPFPPRFFDTVVVTLVLCSVERWTDAIQEIRRVLKTDGKLIFLEHVRSSRPAIRRLQEWLTPLWKHVAAGCHLDRPTDVMVEQNFIAEEKTVLLIRGTPLVSAVYRMKTE